MDSFLREEEIRRGYSLTQISYQRRKRSQRNQLTHHKGDRVMNTQNDNKKPSECPHASTLKEGEGRRACIHLLYPEEDYSSYYKRFTGVGNKYILLCERCASASNQDIEPDNLLVACPECIAEIEKRDWWAGLQGQPELRTRPTTLHFVHEVIRLGELTSGRVLAQEPIAVAGSAQPRFLIIDESGNLLAVDFSEQNVTGLATLGGESVHLGKPLSLHVSPDGQVAAVVNTHGQFGSVFDLRSGQVTMKLQRDTYHIEHCNFPVAFFEHNGALRIVHATAWNRLDVSDPLTGELLTARQFVWREKNPQNPHARPEHYLDYFHCSLLLSPDGEWAVDSGWVWHPVGIVRTWSLRQWMDENVWESEDGSSVRNFAHKEYYWAGPMCWIDRETVAIWGYGGDDEWQIPAAWLFNAHTGQEVGWLPGPEGNFAFREHLFSYSQEKGTAVWDVTAGERLLFDPSLRPAAFHPGAGCFLTLASDGSFIVSRLE